MKSPVRVLSVTLLFNLVVTSGVVFGQSSTEAPVGLDVVASIKPSHVADMRASLQMSPGMLTATNYSIRSLIMVAYQLRAIDLQNVPGWAMQDRFDIVAKFDDPGGASGNTPAMRQMMKVLLADRFKLVLHKETKIAPIYALVLNRSDGVLGPHLRVSTRICQPGTPTAPGARPCGLFGGPTSQMQADAVTMAQLSRLVASVSTVQRVVEDRTGLSGKYDLDLSFTQEVSAAGDPDALPSIFTALKEQLGLQLMPDTGTIEPTIVDHIERPKPD